MPQRLRLFSFVPFDRSARVRWVAHELGIEVEEYRLNYAGGEHRGEAYLARHPFGLVPTVEINGENRWESVAICQSLAERHPEAGLTVPMPAPERAEYLSWLLFAASTFDAPAFQVFNFSSLKPNEQRKKESLGDLLPLLVQLSRHLGHRRYLLGDRFTLPDIILGHAMQLLYLVRVLDDYPVLVDYRSRLSARPAARAAKLFTPRPG